MSLENIIAQFEKKASGAAPIGGTLKFVVDKHTLVVDGTGATNTVSAGDQETDCSITVSSEVLEQLRDGSLNPMMAVMSGKIKIAGDMGLAMKVQSLMG